MQQARQTVTTGVLPSANPLLLASDRGIDARRSLQIHSGQTIHRGEMVALNQGVNEVQTGTITGSPTGGTFTLTYGGQTTSAIAYNATGATVQAALRALSSINGAYVTVTGSAGGPYVVTFSGPLGQTDVAMITVTGSFTGGTSPALTFAETTKGVASSGKAGKWVQGDATWGKFVGIAIEAGDETGCVVQFEGDFYRSSLYVPGDSYLLAAVSDFAYPAMDITFR